MVSCSGGRERETLSQGVNLKSETNGVVSDPVVDNRSGEGEKERYKREGKRVI